MSYAVTSQSHRKHEREKVYPFLPLLCGHSPDIEVGLRIRLFNFAAVILFAVHTKLGHTSGTEFLSETVVFLVLICPTKCVCFISEMRQKVFNFQSEVQNIESVLENLSNMVATKC